MIPNNFKITNRYILRVERRQNRTKEMEGEKKTREPSDTFCTSIIYLPDVKENVECDVYVFVCDDGTIRLGIMPSILYVVCACACV